MNLPAAQKWRLIWPYRLVDPLQSAHFRGRTYPLTELPKLTKGGCARGVLSVLSVTPKSVSLLLFIISFGV
jgi:hypothetical protein